MKLKLKLKETWKKVQDILVNPEKFFKKIKKEKDWKDTLTYFAIISFIGFSLAYIYTAFLLPFLNSINSGFFNSEYLGVPTLDLLQIFLSSYIVSLGIVFIQAALFMVWMILFREEADYQKAFRVVVYSGTPNTLLGWIPYLNLVALIYNFYLFYLAVKIEYDFSKMKTIINISLATLSLIVIYQLILTFLLTVV